MTFVLHALIVFTHSRSLSLGRSLSLRFQGRALGLVTHSLPVEAASSYLEALAAWTVSTVCIMFSCLAARLMIP